MQYCDDCVVASVSTMFEETIQNQNDQTGANTETSPKQLKPHTEEQLRGTKFVSSIPPW